MVPPGEWGGLKIKQARKYLIVLQLQYSYYTSFVSLFGF